MMTDIQNASDDYDFFLTVEAWLLGGGFGAWLFGAIVLLCTVVPGGGLAELYVSAAVCGGVGAISIAASKYVSKWAWKRYAAIRVQVNGP
jgi:hypothetical protein